MQLKYIISIYICIFSFLPLIAEDWPHWRGPKFNGIAHEEKPLTKWPAKGPKILWRVAIGTGFSGMSVYQGTVYTQVGDAHYQYCLALDESSGKALWKKRIAHGYKDGHGSGPRPTPAVSDDKVYATSTHGDLWCLNAKTGKKIWGYNLLNKYKANNTGWGFTSSPLVYKDLLYYNNGAGGGKSLVAVNKNTGEEVWTTGEDGITYCSPIICNIGTKHILFLTNERIVGLEPETGKMLWEFVWRHSVNAATPVIAGDYIFIATSYGKGAVLIHLDYQNGVFTVKEQWKTRRLQNHFNTCVFWENHLYGLTKGFLYCANLSGKGRTKWKQRGFGQGFVAGMTNGYMVVFGERGQVILAKMTPKKYTEIGRAYPFPVINKAYTIPTIANGKLFLRDEYEMICLNISESK